MTIAFVFPGQGSQAVGMGAELLNSFAVARETLEEVDEALKQSLTRLILQGPEDELTLTENAQPALMAVSMAALRVLSSEAGIDPTERVALVAGHSLGEYSALAAAGAIGIADTARLLKTRGRAMQEAVPVGAGAMAALLGADMDLARDVAEAAAEGEVCDVANDNAPGQVVLSGDAAAIDRAVALAKERGIRRSIVLPVSAPFHCRLMKPAADVMAEALEKIEISAPVPSLVANVSAEPVEDPEEIKELLIAQVTAMVRWRESVIAMRDAGVTRIVEVGAGKVLSGLVRRIEPDLESMSVGTPEDVEALVKIL
jgi:[acyl-carrier-protein] S-malonyltransferase